MAPRRSRTRRLVPQNPRRNRSVSNSGLQKNRNQSTWTHSKLKNIKAETIGDAMSKGKNWRDLSDDFNKLMRKCFMEQNLEGSKIWKGQVRKVYLAKKRKAEAKCQVQIWFQNYCPRENRCNDKSRSECNHHYRLASHDVLKSTMASWTWSSASTQKGAKCVDEFRTQLIEELREEKNVRVTLERDMCERENRRSKPPF